MKNIFYKKNRTSYFITVLIITFFIVSNIGHAQECTINFGGNNPNVGNIQIPATGGESSVNFTTSGDCSGGFHLVIPPPGPNDSHSWITSFSVTGNTITCSAPPNDTGTSRATFPPILVYHDNNDIGYFFVNQESCATTTWYLDADQDGHAISHMESCESPGTGYTNQVIPEDDCDDSNPGVYTVTTWYLDADQDGHAISHMESCGSPGTGYTNQVIPEDDCNDSDSAYNPNTVWYLDADGDKHAISHTQSCNKPGTGYTYEVLPEDDCDDSDSIILGIMIWYADRDNDGLRDSGSTPIEDCTYRGAGWTQNITVDDCPDQYDPSNTCRPESNDPIDHNYVYTRTYQKSAQEMLDEEGINQNNFERFTSSEGVVQQITYFDGLGRPEQQVSIEQSPRKSDLVTHIAYDGYGRKDKEWMPYNETVETLGNFRTGNQELSTKQYYENRHSNDFIGLDLENVNPYSQKHFENSSLNSILEQGAPGKDWAMGNGHAINFDYGVNANIDPTNPFVSSDVNVKLFEITFLNNSYESPQLEDNGFYAFSKLSKTITKDENHTAADGKNHTTEEFKNKQGRVVLKRTYADIPETGGTVSEAEPHDTYYVYDDYGNLTYVLPPKMDATTASLADLITNLPELGYQYVYDQRNRLVQKQIPGKGKEYIVYNKLDQPVMTQDANQRVNNEWLFTKYDAFGRVVYTGIYTHTTEVDQGSMQTALEDFYANNTSVLLYENREDTNTANHNYSNTTFPKDNLEVLTVNYYDNYSYSLPTEAPSTVTLLDSETNETNTTLVKGLATGSKVKVLNVSPAKWISTVSYYDAKARPIYGYSKNDYLETVDIVESALDFVGKPDKVKSTHTKDGVTIITIDNFSYDHVGRLLSQTQCIGDEIMGDSCPTGTITDTSTDLPLSGSITGTQVHHNSITVTNATITNAHLKIDPTADGSTNAQELIAFNSYDELGQLQAKKVGGAPEDDYATAQGLQTVDYTYNIRGWLKSINDDQENDNDLFNFSLNYNDPTGLATALYNGNISETHWQTANEDATQKGYGYQYDALNRIKAATGSTTTNYDVSNIAYDKNGNIRTLSRRGHTELDAQTGLVTDYGEMDILSYAYHDNEISNKLYKVRDDGEDEYGFKDSSIDDQDYWYDANGNMTKDDNKGITAITYNHLNLPTEVTIANSEHNGNITYVYDATGVKLRKEVSTGATTDYAGNYIYEDSGSGSKLQFMSQPEGTLSPKNADNYASGFDYVYNYVDHLGNVRLSYTDANNDGIITVSTDPNATEIVKESNYYPFGLEHKGYNSNINGVENNYMTFNGKELDKSLGLDWLDLGARMYDPSMGRFFNVDPQAENYDFQSTYIISLNNPVYLVDFNGEGVLTDYKLIKEGDDAGKVVRVDSNDGSENNKNDRLFSTDENGDVNKDDFIQIDKTSSTKKTIISELSKKKSNANNGMSLSWGFAKNMDEAFKVFKFTAENSNVEWTLAGITNPDDTESYFLGTQFKERLGVSVWNYGVFGSNENLARNRVRFEVHSHPFTRGGSPGDIDRVNNHRLEGGSIDLFYIYHTKSKTLVKYNDSKSNVFEKPIKESKDFYTGKYKN